ncbi:hypothetical protein FHP25_23115 [Vineibacter terrae]|uniref:Uncharacterized protein n=1 Tax=Vineibacter terrae TaxID=2586908 RepID=A0A5C8PIB9_9HYPH|nr:hypothetical protein [Vineibacter terrae]TXL73085.1 hypothetical protein FHP25_23115 [Vineibacter terrae]
MHCPPRVIAAALGVFLLTACTGGGGGGDGGDRPAVTLTSVEPGRFESSRPGTPIPLATIKTMDDRQVAGTFGRPVFQRDESGGARLLRFRSDACDLDLFMYSAGGSWQVRHAEARDRSLRTLPVDRCAGSVSAQKRTA